MGAKVSVELMLNNSAFTRSARAARTTGTANRCDRTAPHIGTCLPFLLEARYSARNATDHDDLLRELMALPMLHIDTEVEWRALDAQRQLAHAGHHRLPSVVADLRFASIWLATRGSLSNSDNRGGMSV